MIVMLRGGSFWNQRNYLEHTPRLSLFPSADFLYTGFRITKRKPRKSSRVVRGGSHESGYSYRFLLGPDYRGCTELFYSFHNYGIRVARRKS
jgi:formylglycine-generating enzyme required for sulfatase activity